jgi:hypothetical protein
MLATKYIYTANCKQNEIFTIEVRKMAPKSLGLDSLLAKDK